MNEEVFLSTISDEGRQWYETILAQLPNDFSKPLIKFTRTLDGLDCRIKVGNRVAGRFWWVPTESRFRVHLLLKPNRFITDRPNGISAYVDGSLQSQCHVSSEEDAVRAGKALNSCVKDLARR